MALRIIRSISSSEDIYIHQSKGKKHISASYLFNKKESVSHQATERQLVSKRVTADVVDVDENQGDNNDSTRPGTSKHQQLVLNPETLTRKVIGMDSKLDYTIKGMTELLTPRRSNNETTVNDDTVCNSSTSFITNSLKTRFPLNSVAEVVEVELALKSNAEFVNKLVADFEFLVVDGKYNKSVSNTIKKVVGSELWKSYAFYGIEKENMASFNALDLCQCIKNAIRRWFPLESESTFNMRAIECALQEAVDVRNNRITNLVNEKLNYLKLEMSTFLEQKEMNCTAVDKSEMSSLYEEVINANQQLTAALERIMKDLAEDPIEKNVHKVVTQLSYSQFGFPYFKDKNGEALSGNLISHVIVGVSAAPTKENDFVVLDRFQYGKRVAAQCIPLDIPAMCFDNKARYDLNNLPWNKIKFVGGEIALHSPRHKENQTINQTRLAYTDGGPGLNNVDRKIMWKMYDRERDYNWIYDVTAKQDTTNLEAPLTRNRESISLISSLIETDPRKRKQRLGQTVNSWEPVANSQYFPQLVKLANNMATADDSNQNGDRLYESMNDHALQSGPLTFPMM
ncbi:hypothetical protein DAPPUDRAFT_317655 [Daphnia pulex]|uniref:DUF4806 domain-containing protein n=1 Tax=Daphnia pulex TaxID=6669 RepID=E9GGL5_DAPPU|nr:hypothetical protein DAPPUDRAFT_317655 [Daphnia pulex]|eukprot:EFX81412.1 hypothetical protein DAPPUDRAFT_317655 [Daphnia pulex]